MIGAARPIGQNRPASSGGGELVALGIGALLVVPSLCCYLAGGLAALIAHGHFATAPGSVVLTLAIGIARHPHDPALAWPAATRHLVPGPVVVYPLCVALFAGAGGAFVAIARRSTRGRRRRGFASSREVKANLSVAAARGRAPQVRPGLSARRADPAELGLHLGREVASRAPLWASLEDSFLVLGPPRSGKGVSLIIPGVLDAPGAVIVTSTRPDVLRHTGAARPAPVEVFDPQGSSGWPTRLRWSPITGCEDPLTAILRARGFAAGAGFERTTTDADFWAASAAAVIRAYLHAAALAQRNISDVVAWAGRPGDAEPIRILRGSPDAAAGWADDLASQAAADPRTRDGVWAGVRRAFDCFADPRVLDACSPDAAEAFDPDRFLAARGTMYVVGSSGAQLSVAPLITALIEDLAERALMVAARSPHGRLDPPLTLFLDEAANIAPLASLPTLLSAGGGSGICTLVVLQSLAQARARWGTDRADSIWDASTVRVVFGGLGHADDLTRISRLAGEIDEEVGSASRGAGGPTWSTSLRQRPVLPLERIRSLEPGRALVLHRRTPPVETVLEPWWRRPCANRIRAALAEADRRCHGGIEPDAKTTTSGDDANVAMERAT
jgi:type IV secretion system protein VirD4